MKKLIVLLSLLTITLPVFASNWVQLDSTGKNFVDISSLQKEHEYGRYNLYSIWVKFLNDGSDYYKTAEQIYNKKIWYDMNKIIVDCKENDFTIETSTFYDIDRNAILTRKYYRWDAIIPESTADIVKQYICGLQNK